MIHRLKAEFRKLATVRSTYGIIIFGLVLTGLFGFWADGYRVSGTEQHNPAHFSSEIVNAAQVLSLVFSLITVLLVTHEYRYNTILYTLASAKSRTQIFLAKFLASSIAATVLMAIFIVLAPAASALGASMAGHPLVHQDMPSWNLIGRALFVGWVYSGFAFVISMLVRVQVAAFAIMFLLPGTIEQLLGLLLKDNQVYLPFSSLNAVLSGNDISHTTAMITALIWLVGLGALANVLFLKRDAN